MNDEDIPDNEVESEDSNSNSDVDDPDDHPISTQTAVEEFTSQLREAQHLAIEIKKDEKRGKKKIPQTYPGNSKKTQQCHEKARKDLASKGFLGIVPFMALKEVSGSTSRSQNCSLEYPEVNVHGIGVLDGGLCRSTPSTTPVYRGWRKGRLAIAKDEESEEVHLELS